MADITASALLDMPDVLVITSTYNEGEPPERAEGFFASLMAEDAPRLEGVRYAVLALGDLAYENFCGFGHSIDDRFAELGAVRAAGIVECDFDYATTAAAWVESALAERAQARPLDGHAPRDVSLDPVVVSGTTWLTARIVDRTNLHVPPSAAETVHVSLSIEGPTVGYEPGDLFLFQPQNDPDTVEAVLQAVGLTQHDAVRQQLLHERDITTLTAPLVSQYAQLSGAPHLLELAESPEAMSRFVVGRHPIDVFQSFPTALTAEQVLSLLRPLPARSYSVASSLRARGNQIDLVVARTAWQTTTPAGTVVQRYGVASGDLIARRTIGDPVRIAHKSNPHFRLPDDPDRAVIMIGAGSGVAPFRGFLQERQATGARGPNWLMFGHRSATQDFFYADEWQAWLDAGVLTRLDLAFSRDQAEKVYVQHKLLAAQDTWLEWMDAGAVVYICGDKTMGDDVEDALCTILAQHGRAGPATLGGWKRDGQVRKDVY